eukprot:jgi/Mesen1/4799/ME000243S03976
MAPSAQDSVPAASVLVHRMQNTIPEVTRHENGHDCHQTKRTGKESRKVIVHTKKVITKQADLIKKQATEHEHFINKVTYCVGVVTFGIFCYLLGSRPQDIPYLYCAFFLSATPLRWIYYRSKKWHYFLLDFCYYANAMFTIHLLFFPKNEKFFLICFAFSEGPLAWALIVWRCSLVFSSLDKIVSVLIHLLPGTVIFIIRWWDPVTFTSHLADETGPWPAWPLVERAETLWIWLFVVPLALYSLWQLLYFAIVDGLRKQRLLNDPQILTSYRELSRKAARANNMWWRLSGVLGDHNRVVMYAILQAVFTVIAPAALGLLARLNWLDACPLLATVSARVSCMETGPAGFHSGHPRLTAPHNLVKKSSSSSSGSASALSVATMALAVPMFRHYRIHAFFQFFKIAASIWQGGNFFFDVMPRQVHAKAEKKKAQKDSVKKELQAGPDMPSAGISAMAPAPTSADTSAPADPSSPELNSSVAVAGSTNGAMHASPSDGMLCAACRRVSLNELAEEASALTGAIAAAGLRATDSSSDLKGNGASSAESDDDEVEEIWEEVVEEVLDDEGGEGVGDGSGTRGDVDAAGHELAAGRGEDQAEARGIGGDQATVEQLQQSEGRGITRRDSDGDDVTSGRGSDAGHDNKYNPFLRRSCSSAMKVDGFNQVMYAS